MIAIKTFNVEAGMPVLDEARRLVIEEIRRAKKEGVRVLKVIHVNAERKMKENRYVLPGSASALITIISAVAITATSPEDVLRRLFLTATREPSLPHIPRSSRTMAVTCIRQPSLAAIWPYPHRTAAPARRRNRDPKPQSCSHR